MAALIGIFVIVTVLVELRTAASLDIAVAAGAQQINSALLDRLAAAAAVLLAFEPSLLYAAAGSLMLSRARAGYYSLLPFGFVMLTAIEVGMKLFVYQPGVPLALQRPIHYPLIAVTFQGSYPSGHAIRSAYAAAFAAIVLAPRRGLGRSVTFAVLALAALLFGLSRVYLGEHWLSDVLAGLALGGAVGLVCGWKAQAALKTRGTGP
ncbi:MAG TPA: phosphatase PAP2 family protein [Chloroflexota bacterium]|nr:phosphatase PAP2 family protein [Chloroflexota bacterium]